MSAQPSVFGVAFSEMSLNEIASAVTRDLPPRHGGLQLLLTMNLDHVVTLRRDTSFRSAYSKAAVVTADGFPVYLYARLRGARVPGRVTGSDLFPRIMERLIPGRHRPFLVASHEATRRRLESRLLLQGFARSDFAVVVPPYGFESDVRASSALIAQIQSLKPTHLFFGVGAPKSEIWMDHHRDQLGDAFAFAFGSGLDFYVGTARRAPRVVREAGFEWLWRFGSEPRRLFRRYFIDSWGFVAAIADDLRTRGRPFAR
ncbi:MAG: WecB/TagA/CpsF family glycosyltransferase [Hyphomicrobiaceae bacterium]